VLRRRYGHVLRMEENDWMKNCTDFEMEGVRPTGGPKKTWTEVKENDC